MRYDVSPSLARDLGDSSVLRSHSDVGHTECSYSCSVPPHLRAAGNWNSGARSRWRAGSTIGITHDNRHVTLDKKKKWP